MSEFNSADQSSKLPMMLGGGLFIAVLAMLVYWPSFKGTFIIDDDQYVTQNPNVRSSDGLYRLWFTQSRTDFYNPIPYSTFWLEWRLWGMNPTGYRIANLLLHIASACLLWAILKKLAIPGAFLGAVLFAVHPVNVECVAWIFQRRDLLAVAFGLLSIACYLQADPRFLATRQADDAALAEALRISLFRTWGWYALSLAAYALAMLSKISIAPLPVILLLIIWWIDRIRFWDLARLGPFFLIDAAVVGFNLWLRAHNFPVVRSSSLVERLDRAGTVVWFYLSKALLPIKLSLTYPQWHINTSALLWWLPLLAAASVTALLFWRRQGAWSRALFCAWAIFCVAIAPVLGILDVGGFGHSIVWDHYEYLALIGVTGLVAAGWGYWRQRTKWRRGLGALAAALVCILSLLTWQRSSLFGSSINLYQDAFVKNPDSWLANLNYGSALANTGRTEEAIELLRQALQTWPDYAEGYRRLGAILLEANRPQEAAEYFQQSLRLDSDYPPAHNNLGIALARLDRTPEGIEQFAEALRLQPDFAEAHLNLGVALSKLGQLQEGIKQFEEALRLYPDSISAYTNLTKAYVLLERPAEAIASAEKALQLARAQGKTAEEGEITAWLASYRSQQNNSSSVAPRSGADPATKSP